MGPSRLCYQVYRYRRAHMRVNRSSWCLSVKKLLLSLNMEHIWESETVDNLKAWEFEVKTAIEAREQREWGMRIGEKPKLRFYRQVKSQLRFEEYLVQVQCRHHRREITLLRCGTNDLRLEEERWNKE